MQRLRELRTLVTSAFVQLAITGRDQRLIALQERWDGLRQTRAAIAAGDYAAAMRTGLVCRKLRTVGGAKNARVVEEYEINTPLIEALNSVEKRAAIETGQEQENFNLTGQISSKAIALSKVMTIPELEELERKMLAVMEEEKKVGKVGRGSEMNGRRIGLGCRANRSKAYLHYLRNRLMLGLFHNVEAQRLAELELLTARKHW